MARRAQVPGLQGADGLTGHHNSAKLRRLVMKGWSKMPWQAQAVVWAAIGIVAVLFGLAVFL